MNQSPIILDLIIARALSRAEQRADIRAIALVGESAQLIVLTTEPGAYAQREDWLRELQMESAEVELDFAPLSWASLAPIDFRTRRAVMDGLRIVYDPDRILEDLRSACLEAPVIETERLTLRGHRREDLRECAEMWADPAVTEHIGGKPFSEEEVWTKVVRYLGHWSMMGFGYWVVREKGTGRFAGEVGFADFKRAIIPSFDGAPECGWVLMPWAQGRGFATEAVRAVHLWLAERFGPTRTVCMIAPENTASIRVAEKCGYREWVRTTYREEPTILFHRNS